MKRDLVLRLLDRSRKLVSSARVEGAVVYNFEGERLGTMHSVMIDKRSGRVSYAVMLLDGAGDEAVHAHPLPWAMLDYDPAIGGYRANLSREVLDRAPDLTLDDDDRLREILETEYPATALGSEGGMPTPAEKNDFNSQTT